MPEDKTAWTSDRHHAHYRRVGTEKWYVLTASYKCETIEAARECVAASKRHLASGSATFDPGGAFRLDMHGPNPVFEYRIVHVVTSSEVVEVL